MELAKVTIHGQITLPLEIRKKLQVKEGDKVVFIENNGRIIVESASRFLPPPLVKSKSSQEEFSR